LNRFFIILGFLLNISFPIESWLTADDFVRETIKNEPDAGVFLMELLAEKFSGMTVRDAGNLFLSVSPGYSLVFSELSSSRGEASISLDKLFPLSGTRLSVTYNSRPRSFSTKNIFNSTELGVTLNQSLLKNAFGKMDRVNFKSAEILVKAAEIKLTESYEDYVAGLYHKYFDWVETWHRHNQARSLYQADRDIYREIKSQITGYLTKGTAYPMKWKLLPYWKRVRKIPANIRVKH